MGITFIYVTHDQGEALSMSDRVAVFNHGRIEQMATRASCTRSPRHAVRRALRRRRERGLEAKLRGKLAGNGRSRSRSARRTCSVLALADAPPPGYVSAEGTVLDVQYHGATSRWQVQLDGGDISPPPATPETSRASRPRRASVCASPGRATTWSRWTDG